MSQEISHILAIENLTFTQFYAVFEANNERKFEWFLQQPEPRAGISN